MAISTVEVELPSFLRCCSVALDQKRTVKLSPDEFQRFMESSGNGSED